MHGQDRRCRSCKTKEQVDHIVLNDLYIHDVTGNVYNKHMTNGGIYFIVEKPENESATGIARYNDVTIQNCYLDTVNRWGIAVGYTYEWAKFNGGALSDETMKTYASSDVVIQNNYLNNVGGDAITTMYIDRPVIQYNVSENDGRLRLIRQIIQIRSHSLTQTESKRKDAYRRKSRGRYLAVEM